MPAVLRGGMWQPVRLDGFTDEVTRLHQVLEDLGSALDGEALRNGISLEQLLQGTFADAMTHVCQLAMLRRLAGSPVPSENFMFATIGPGNLGPDWRT